MESNLTPSSGQDSTTNSQTTRSKTDPAWEHVSKERYANGRKTLICLYCKKIAKGNMAEGEEKVQEMQSPMEASNGKKKPTVDKYFVPRNTQGAQPFVMSVLAGKKAIWRADMTVGKFFYDACIPTNVDAKKEVQLLVDSYRAIWVKVEYTIMGDSWTDNRQRTLINFLVYCPEGISFVKSVDASNIVKDATNLFMLLISQKHKHINWSPCATHCLNLIFKDIGEMDHVAELVRRASKENFCNIGGVMDVIDQKVPKGKLDTMNEMKLFCDRLGSFGRDLAYSSHEKRIYDPIDYACINETDFWIVDEAQPIELDVEELENLLYEKGLIPIIKWKVQVFTLVNGEDGGGVAIEGLDVENFGFPDAHFQSPYSNFQNE
ncbi:hypothetical protein AAG906_041170 [Vitis piasezkii]